MEKVRICDTENLKENIEKLKEMGYKYIVKANDKFLGGSFSPYGKKHVQLIACETSEQKRAIIDTLSKDNTYNYINWERIENYDKIYAYTRGKTYSIRNDYEYCYK